jgi:hypothetical protein
MKALLLVAGVLLLMGHAKPSFAQEETEASPDEVLDTAQAPSDPQSIQANTNASAERTLEDTDVAGESDVENKRQLVRWNQNEGPYFTVKFGAGFLYEVDAYAQDRQSKEQFVSVPRL